MKPILQIRYPAIHFPHECLWGWQRISWQDSCRFNLTFWIRWPALVQHSSRLVS
jgi:hypothetical protein